MVWSIPPTKGNPPEGRSFHQMQMLSESSMVISGGIRGGFDKEHRLYKGLHILNLKTMEWSKPRIGGSFPSPRYAHLLATSNEPNAPIILFGGLQYNHKPTGIDIFVVRQNLKEAEMNWYIVTVEDKEEEKKTQERVQRAENTIFEQKRKIGDLEASIKSFKESM